MISKASLIQFFQKGGKLLGEAARDAYGEHLNQVGKQAFEDAIEIGISNTIAALCDARVSDKETLRVVCLHWGISVEDAEDRLVFEKKESAIRSLKQYLKLNGWSPKQIDDFFHNSLAAIHIRHSNELWKLKDNPEKLFKEISSKKKLRT